MVRKWLDIRHLLWMGTMAAGTSVAGWAGLKFAVFIWRKVRHSEPPEEPEYHTTAWVDALLWTLLASVTGGLFGVSIRRIARSGWRHVLGEEPPE